MIDASDGPHTGLLMEQLRMPSKRSCGGRTTELW